MTRTDKVCWVLFLLLAAVAWAVCGCVGQVSGVRNQGAAQIVRDTGNASLPSRALVVTPMGTNVLPSRNLGTAVNVYGTTIPRRGDGLHSLVYTKNFGSQNIFGFFKSLSDLNEVEFGGFGALNEPVVEFAEDSIVLADTDYGSGIKVGEFQIANGTDAVPNGSFYFGDGTTRAPAVRRLKNGGLVIAAYRHDYSSTLEIAYRNALNSSPPPLPGQPSPPLWIFGTFVLEPAPSGEAPIQLTIAECPSVTGGYFNVYFNRDGTHQIKRARFQVANNAVNLLDYDGTWASDSTFNGIPRDGEMSPDMEFPFVAAVTDWANKRILVSYSQSRMIYSEVQCDLVVTRPVIVSDWGTNKTLVATGPECIDRSTSPNPILISQSLLTSSPTIHCLYDFVDPSDCNYRWRWFDGNGVASILQDSNGSAVNSGFGHYLGYSCDGYVLAKDNNNATRLFILPIAPPKLFIVRDTQSASLPRVKITWDADASWKLQSSVDFLTWLDLPEATSPCWFSADTKNFFRLKRVQ